MSDESPVPDPPSVAEVLPREPAFDRTTPFRDVARTWSGAVG